MTLPESLGYYGGLCTFAILNLNVNVEVEVSSIFYLLINLFTYLFIYLFIYLFYLFFCVEIPNFLSDNECDHIIRLAESKQFITSVARGGLQSKSDFAIPDIRSKNRFLCIVERGGRGGQDDYNM